MSLKQLIYPLDLTGERQANRISERHVIGVNQYRAFSLKHGPFYTKELTVKERNGTKPLRRGIDYECVFFYSKLAMLTKGLEIAGVIVIINPDVSTDIEVHANIVGGPYTHTAEAIQQAIEALELDNRNQYWREVVEKPDLFQPTPHIHDLGDVFGFQFIVDIIGQMTDVLMIGDNAQMVDIKERIKALEDDLKRRFKEHFEDKKNPHKVTAHQTNAYFKEEIDKFLEDVQKQFGENAETFSDVFRRIGEINDTISSIQGVIKSINAGQSRQDKQLNRFQKLLADLTRQIDAIKDEIKEIWAAIESLRERDKELQASIDRNANRIQEETERNDDQDGEIRREHNKNDEQDGRLDALRNEVSTLKSKVADLEMRGRGWDESIADIYDQIDNINPVGEVYVQFPGTSTPATLYGGSWVKMFSNESIFFRTEGPNATGFNGGIQGDAIRNMKGKTGFGATGGGSGYASGVFRQHYYHFSEDGGNGNGTMISFDASRVVPTSNENRPRNRTIRVWRKVAHD